MAVNYGSLPFAEAIEYLRNKVNLPTEHWDDIEGQAHDRYFMVAGAAKADLLSDLHEAVRKGIEDGTTLEEFRRDFDQAVFKSGWTGFTGEDTPGGLAWRTQTIYGTNLRTAYQAGRHAQHEEGKADRPYLQYHHADGVENPRPLHLKWDGTILPIDDPWWQAHKTPNGWGCRCYTTSLAPRDLKRLGKAGPDPRPDDGTYVHTDRNGVPHTLPKGVDYGWDHAPGATRDLLAEIKAKAGRYPEQVRKDLAGDLSRIDLGAFPRGPGAGRVTMAAGTDAAHARVVRDAFAALPKAAQDLIAAENYRVVAVPRLSAGAAHMRTTSPLGMPPGTSWDHLAGVTTTDGHILIAQETMVGLGAAPRVAAVAPDLARGTLAHEVAHAIDRVHSLSADPAVRQALAADLASLGQTTLSAVERLDVDYISLAAPRGPAEAVAELFANRHGGRTAAALDMTVALPRTAAVLKTMLDGLNL